MPKEVYVHPEWNGDAAHGFDVGLLWLDRKAPFKKLSIDKTGDALSSQASLTAASRTCTDAYKAGGELLLAENLTVVSSSACESVWHTEIEDYMGCISHAASTDPFHGALPHWRPIRMSLWSVEYLGAPLLMLDKPKGRLSRGKPQADVLIGIASFGAEEFRQEKSPAVYTRVSAFWDWIEATMNKKTVVGCRTLVTIDRVFSRCPRLHSMPL